MQRLYVGGLSHTVTQKDLTDRFGKFGNVEDVELRTRRDDEGEPWFYMNTPENQGTAFLPYSQLVFIQILIKAQNKQNVWWHGLTALRQLAGFRKATKKGSHWDILMKACHRNIKTAGNCYFQNVHFCNFQSNQTRVPSQVFPTKHLLTSTSAFPTQTWGSVSEFNSKI